MNPHPPPAKHSEHTALPWKVSKQVQSGGSVYIGPPVNGDSGHVVGIIEVYDTGSPDEHEANARFIVTACNSYFPMIEALVRISALETTDTKSREIARTALALAEGRDV